MIEADIEPRAEFMAAYEERRAARRARWDTTVAASRAPMAMARIDREAIETHTRIAMRHLIYGRLLMTCTPVVVALDRFDSSVARIK